jgi:hypothetical protein
VTSDIDPNSLGPVAGLDPDLVRPAQLTCARLAARHGATVDDLRLVLASLGLIDGGPSGARYTPEGRRVRPTRTPKGARVPEPRPNQDDATEATTASNTPPPEEDHQ